jgi:hypothetical protein
MRDLVAGIFAIVLIVVALSLATTLRRYRQARQRARDSERALGRTIIAELPTADALVLFSEDAVRFYYGDLTVDKDLITAVRVLINGAPIATIRAAPPGGPPAGRDQTTGPREIIDSRPEGIARDRWDVAIETVRQTVVVECGSIRERVSQELARSVFDAVKREIEWRNAG